MFKNTFVKRIKLFIFSKIELIVELLNRRRNFILYFVIGLSGAFLDFSIFAVLYKGFAFNEVLSNIVASFIGFNNNFFLNAFFNFKTKENLRLRYFSYFLVCICGLVISSSFLYIMVSVMNFNAFVFKFIAMIFIFIAQYFLNKKITFKNISLK